MEESRPLFVVVSMDADEVESCVFQHRQIVSGVACRATHLVVAEGELVPFASDLVTGRPQWRESLWQLHQ
jgi:predicted amidohydrolase